MPHERRRGQAFCTLLEHLDPHSLPEHGGDATHIVITIDHGALLHGLGTAVLADGTRITADQARRLACTAGILPAVLDGNSEVLDHADLLCPHHHHRIHDPDYTHQRLPGGSVTFHRRM